METEFERPGLNCPENQENYWSLQKEKGGFNLTLRQAQNIYLFKGICKLATAVFTSCHYGSQSTFRTYLQ